jgi:radical SAM family protein/iron-sulfur cluster protein
MIVMNHSHSLQTSPYIVMGETSQNGLAKIHYVRNGAVASKVDAQTISLLNECIKPRTPASLEAKFDSHLIESLVTANLLIDPCKLWEWHSITRVEIEIGTYCNWSCEFCPNRRNPKLTKTMSMDLFTTIVEKAERLPSVTSVTLHSYNEPTLDKDFEVRIDILAKTRLKLDLYTNGTGLTENKLQHLTTSGVVNTIVFNFPALNEERFKAITGSNTYRQTIRSIERSIELGLDVRFAILSTGDSESIERIKALRQHFGQRLKHKVDGWGAVDRAGFLTNTKYAQNIHITEGFLYGCHYPLWQLNISVDGNCFICCQDFEQKEVFGNILDGEIDEIINSERAQNLRKEIFGGRTASPNLICRRCALMAQMGRYRAFAGRV